MKIAITSTRNSPDATLDSRLDVVLILLLRYGIGVTDCSQSEQTSHGRNRPCIPQLVASKVWKKWFPVNSDKVKAIFDSLKIQLIIVNDGP